MNAANDDYIDDDEDTEDEKKIKKWSQDFHIPIYVSKLVPGWFDIGSHRFSTIEDVVIWTDAITPLLRLWIDFNDIDENLLPPFRQGDAHPEPSEDDASILLNPEYDELTEEEIAAELEST